MQTLIARCITMTVVLFSLNDLTVNGQDTTCAPSPMNFMTQYLEQCATLQQLNSSTCQRAWTSFSTSFAGKDPDSITPENYRDYFTNVLPPNPGLDESLFWSRTNELVALISCMCDLAQVESSANTPSTAIINRIGRDLSWCGTTNISSTDGIETANNCPCEVSRAFFEEFSATFARVARGTIFYLGYGERDGGTFNKDSFFAKYELPNLRRPEVTNAVVMVVHRNGTGESCGKGTLVDLRTMVEARGFRHSCYDVFGNLDNTSEVTAIRDCAVGIIKAEQQGMEPVEDSCFMKGTAGASSLSLSSMVIVTVSILLAVVTSQ